MFGRLSSVVKVCKWAPRFVRASIIGGPGSGKTYGAIGMASGMRVDDGVIVLISAGENRAEEMYSSLTEFHHVDCADVAGILNLRDMCAEGTDPRVAAAAVSEVANNAPAGSVVIFDSVSDVWDGAKSHIDRITRGDDRKNRQAWATVTPWWTSFWSAIESCRSHIIVTVRAKTVSDQERGPGGRTLTVQIPADQENRNRDQFRTDCRIFLDSFHRVWCEGRLTGINTTPPADLSPRFGVRLAAYCATGNDPGDNPVDLSALPMVGRPSKPVPQPTHENRPSRSETPQSGPAPVRRQNRPSLPPYGRKMALTGAEFAAACISVDVRPDAYAAWYAAAGGTADVRGDDEQSAYRRGGLASMLAWGDMREAVQRGIPADSFVTTMNLPGGKTPWDSVKAGARAAIGGES